MDVLEDYQDGLRRRHLLKLGQQRRQRGVLLLLRAHGRERIANVGRQRQQVAQECNAMLRWRTVFREPGFELGPLRGGRVASLKPRCALQLPDKGRQRAVGVMRRAKVVQRHVRFGPQQHFERQRDMRFSDAGLSGEQYGAAFAVLGGPPASHQQLDLLVTAERRKHARPMLRLKAAFYLARTSRLPDPN